MGYVVALPTADRRRAYDFYVDTLRLEPVGPVADDGLPEPLQFILEPGVNLMLVPTGGFGWAIADHAVAGSGQSECVMSVLVSGVGDVDDITERARQNGAVIKQEPHDSGWGYSSTLADPDGHLWTLEVQPGSEQEAH